jgi:hypothetical protein
MSAPRAELIQAIEKWHLQDRAAKRKANAHQPPASGPANCHRCGHHWLAHDDDYVAHSCNLCKCAHYTAPPDDTGYGSAKDFADAIARSGGLERVTDDELRDIALASGWQPIGDGYYHRDVGTVTCVPPCEDANIIDATELQRAACVLVVVSVIVGYCAVIAGVGWVCGRIFGEW